MYHVLLSVIAASSDSSASDVNTLRDVLFPCLSLLVVATLVLLLVCLCRCRRQRAAAAAAAADVKPRPGGGAPLRRSGSGAASTEVPVELAASSVRLVCDLCDQPGGGRVYLGELAVQPCPRPVVVRTLGADADERSRTEFWRDVDALHALRHPHVAAVLGVTGRSTTGATALASVLLECGPDLTNLHQYVVVAGTSLDHATRLRVAVQLAAGMDYLSSRGVVHGDLAARNVAMVSGSGPPVAKLSVGLSLGPALFPGDYQTVHSDFPPLPVRWMAPEAIAGGGRTPTTAGDVWSYGVTLWELFSAGCRPYEGFADHELVDLILSRRLLPCPPPPVQTAHATSRVYALMVDCWAQRPDDRPSFVAVVGRLEQWQAADAAASTAAGARRPGSSNGTPSNSGGRPSPYPPAPGRTCLVGPAKDLPQSELTDDGELRSRGGENCTPQSAHRGGRRVVDDRCRSTASVSSDRRHDVTQLPTDAI